ncbi:MAG: glycosyltransferase family 39 protein [Candidatus Omnitrophica bacterium]|nr:glycosyltransferase family 39 protein [Candidatus Omnitrophota bacterium]
MNLSSYIKRIPREIRFLTLIFLSSRFILTVIGVSSRNLLDRFYAYCPRWIYSRHLWLDIWGIHDSGWYLGIANEWYPAILKVGESSFGFFPLYPLLMRLLGGVIGSNYIAGIIVSNICLVITAVFLYKLVKLTADDDTALRTMKYLIVFPSAFILSAVFAESLFLALLVICFYYAKKEKWLLVGVSGFLLSLTKAIGVVVILPLLYEYLKAKRFKLQNLKRDIFFLLMIPLGPSVFAAYTYYLTGDFYAYVFAQISGWGTGVSNPLVLLYRNIFTDIHVVLSVLAIVLLLSVFCKRIGFSYWLLGILFIISSLMSGQGFIFSIGRFVVVIFPMYIALAELGRDKGIDEAVTLFLAILQGCFMAFWSAGFNVII